jgi:hypothetical protein
MLITIIIFAVVIFKIFDRLACIENKAQNISIRVKELEKMLSKDANNSR